MWGCNYNGTGLGHLFFGGGIIGFSFTLLIIMVIAGLIFKLVKTNQSANSSSLDKRDTLEILKIRFVRGEITEEEYDHMKSVL